MHGTQFAVPAPDTPKLFRGIDCKEYPQAVVAAQHWMAGIGALDDIDRVGMNPNRLAKGLTVTIVRPIGKILALFERQQGFFQKTLIIHVATRFPQPFRSALLRAQEKMIHVDDVAG